MKRPVSMSRGAPVLARRARSVSRSAWVWLVFIALGVIATALYAANVAPAPAFLYTGASCVVALGIGPRWHKVRPRRPWQLLRYAMACFLFGSLVRPLVAGSHGPLIYLSSLFTVPGYLLMITSLGYFLYARRGIERNALIDGLIVCVGAVAGTIVLFTVPSSSIPGRSLGISLLAGLYPLFDAVLILLTANLAFTTAARRPSFVLLVVTMTLIFCGDLSYAIIGIHGTLYGNRLLDLPFLLSFTMLGAAALHPSAADLVRITPLPIQDWSWRRLLLIVPPMAVPFVLTATTTNAQPVERVVLGIGGAVIVALLLTRAVSAVQSYAAAQRRYQHQATHDPLTGLPNRRMLTPAVERIVAPSAEDGSLVWMFFLDLDGFKFINDSYGHTVGDQLIIQMGRRLEAHMPAGATLARVGGDEFVVVQLGGKPAAMALAQRIMDCVQEPLQVGNAEVVISASMGIACADPRSDLTVSAESLMRDADTAMYKTKAEGRGGWTVFDASMHRAVLERIEIEAALRSALALDQLHLVYQPIVDLPTGLPLGAEALIRWDHPERGPIPPGMFIPIAEQSSLIAQIGTWVLRKAIRQVAEWRAAGSVKEDFWMSINVSARQFTDTGLPGLIAEELMQQGLPARCVVLEITESLMVEGSDGTEQVIRDLRALGLRISVDDFGTGFSALGYLRRHPVTGVKIDRSFVAGLGANSEDEEIVRAVVAMSTALGLTVVAEGVETTGQRDVLAGLGVPLGQGWLWGRGVRAEQFVEQWSPQSAGASMSKS
jgi:diguanylate cyclase (GGDEF)-like protein